MSLIKKMLEEIDVLENELMSCASIESCFPIQERLTLVVKEAMEIFKEGKMQVDVKALTLPMYIWATEELPEQIKNQENIDEIKKQLRLFKNSIQHILRPTEL